MEFSEDWYEWDDSFRNDIELFCKTDIFFHSNF